MKSCRTGECKGHEGICCMSCPDLISCSAPCESMDSTNGKCEEGKLMIVGSKVMLRPVFGMGEPIEATISDFGTHKGKSVIDYKGTGGQLGWAYFSQIDTVL